MDIKKSGYELRDGKKYVMKQCSFLDLSLG